MLSSFDFNPFLSISITYCQPLWTSEKYCNFCQLLIPSIDFNKLSITPTTFSQLITDLADMHETSVNFSHLLCTDITNTTKSTIDLWLFFHQWIWNKFILIYVNICQLTNDIYFYQNLSSYIELCQPLQTSSNFYHLL